MPGPMINTVAEEKAEMHHLNDRLAAYMDKVRTLKQQGPAIDPTKYHEAMRSLEDELNKLKNLYEKELDKLRRQLKDANRERSALASNAEANREAAEDLKQKLADVCNRNKKLQDDIDRLHRHLADKEKENADLKAKVNALANEVDSLRPNAGKLNKDNDELRRRLESEHQKRKEAEDAVKLLKEKLGFDNQKNGQENQDLCDRLRKANDIIRELENKIKAMSKQSNDDTAKLIAKLREANTNDLRKYQKETEDALNRDLRKLKEQIDRDAAEKDRLNKELARIQDALRQLQAKCSDLEGQNQGLCAQNGELRRDLDAERARYCGRIKDLEDKLRELQDMLMDKTKDFNKARDAQGTLKKEIEEYRMLLDAENHRAQMASRGGTSAGNRPPNNTHYTPQQFNANSNKANTSAYDRIMGGNKVSGPETTYRHDYTGKQGGRRQGQQTNASLPELTKTHGYGSKPGTGYRQRSGMYSP